MKKNKDNYTGKISFYDMHQNISLSNEFENGPLTFNGMARRKSTRNITGKSAGCIDWYWVTGSSYIYLYTTCDCYAYRMSGIKCGGGGGLSSSSSGPAYPSNPPDKTLFTYIDEDGQIITKRYNEEALTWEFFSISLSEVVVNNNYVEYYYLIFQWPKNQQKVVKDNIIYTYDGASASWVGESEEEIINELTGKAKCLNDLLDKDRDSFVQNLLTNFEGESEFDIKIVSKDNLFSTKTDLEVNGNTSYEKGSSLINIAISSSRTESRSALEVARIILHEYIHADIFRKLYTINTAPAGETDFKITFSNLSDHGAMAELYINSLTEALKAFHKNVLTNDYNNYTNYFGAAPSDDFYRAFAWGGLKDADVPAWEALSAEQKTAINQLADREILLSKVAPCLGN